MKTNLKDLMMKYGVTLGIRYTDQQKELFYNEVSKDFKTNGWDCIKIDTTKKVYKNSTIIAGDYKSAHTIIMAAYDTPTKINLPHYLYFPFNAKANIKYESYNLILSFICFTILCIALFFILKDFTTLNIALKCLAVLATIVIAYLTYTLFSNKPNKVNFNKNSASISLIMYLSEILINEKVAFILIDHATTSYDGLKEIEKLLSDEQIVIYLDALAEGEKLVLAHSEAIDSIKFKELLRETNGIDKSYTREKVQNNLLHFFNKMYYLGSGSISKQQFIVKNTRCAKDYQVNIQRLELIARHLEKICKGEI